MNRPRSDAARWLAVDSGSPLVSVAVAVGDDVVAERSVAQQRSSAALLRLIDETLRQAGLRAGDLDGLIGLRGPGSFTGLRVGLATLLGLHEALAVPAVALPTLDVLASLPGTDRGTVVAVVDALRGEWFARPFAAGLPVRPLAAASRLRPRQLLDWSPELLVGFGVERLAAELDGGAVLRCLEPGPLAPAALRFARQRPPVWDAATLVAPLYLRQAAVTPEGGG